VEKAHPDVFNVLLQVLDDGRLTDGQGRTVDFRNTVIIMTSNLGSQIIQEMAGEENYDAMKSAVMEVVGATSAPSSSTASTMWWCSIPWAGSRSARSPASRSDDLRPPGGPRHGSGSLSDAALDRLGEAGFDPVYGARPLKRAIQQQLENPLAQEILAGRFGPGAFRPTPEPRVGHRCRAEARPTGRPVPCCRSAFRPTPGPGRAPLSG
jgi:ATP-dependent Clp protease ATP-binding subunit ClpB